MTVTDLRPPIAGTAAGLTDLECGTLTGYKIRLCRCPACTQANTTYQSRRSRLIAYGQWKPLIDAQPVREHVQALQAAGLGWRRIAALADVTPSVVGKLLYGAAYRGQAPTSRVRPETAAALLAVQADGQVLADGATVDASGSRRRLQALIWCGWSQAKLARALDLDPTNLSALLHRRYITVGTARSVRALYEQLWDVAPPTDTHRDKIAASRARNHATTQGWLPPMAWDEDLIDLTEADLEAEINRQVDAMTAYELQRCHAARYQQGDRTPVIAAAAREYSRRSHTTSTVRRKAS